MIKAYFFDWMSTLANYEGKDYVRELLTTEQHHFLLTHKLEEIDISEEERDTISHVLVKAKHFVYPDSEAVINILKGLNYKLAIVSNIYEITARKIRELFPDFLDKFDVVALSPELGMMKPQQEIFLYTLTNLNQLYNLDIALEEVMMIGDKPDKDIEAAEKLGMQARLIDRKKGQTLIDFIE